MSAGSGVAQPTMGPQAPEFDRREKKPRQTGAFFLDIFVGSGSANNCQQQYCHNVYDLDHRVDGGPCRVLVGIADRIAGH